MRWIVMKWAILAALALLVAGNVHAETAREDGRERPEVARDGARKRSDDAPTAAQIAACAPDAQRLCLQHIGNRAAMRACMTEHRNQLSETCKAAFR